MEQIEFTLDNDFKIRIEVADTKFGRKWINYYKRILANHQNWKFGSVTWNGYIPKNNDQAVEYLEALLAAFIKLNTKYSLGFEESIALAEQTLTEAKSTSAFKPFKIKQELLNRWHRNFTSLMTNQLYNNIVIDLNDPEVFTLVHSLNEYVHRLETICSYPYLSRRLDFADKPIYYSYMTNANNPDASKELFEAGAAEWIKDRFDPLVDSTDYTVWLNEDILGKDLIRSWLDFDDQNCSDITGNLFMTPGLMFDPYYNFRELMKSPDWLKSYSETHKTLDRFPIGNIINYPDWGKLNTANDFRIKSITITEDIPFFSAQNSPDPA